ncbi:MAG: type II secretion system protein N [Glycocaulis sp.]
MTSSGRSQMDHGARFQRLPGLSRRVVSTLVFATELALVVLAGALLASLVWTFLYGSYTTALPAPSAAIDARSSQSAARMTSASATGLFRQAGRSAAPSVEILPESRLGFALFGVRTGATPQEGSAIIEAGAAGQRSYRAGSALQDGVTLDAVHSDRVVISRNGSREVLYLSERARTRRTVPAEPLQAVALAGISLSPHPLQSGGEGLRIDNIPPALSALGLQPGDIIASVEGEALSPERVSALSAGLADGTLPASLQFERGGERLSLQTRSNP